MKKIQSTGQRIRNINKLIIDAIDLGFSQVLILGYQAQLKVLINKESIII